MNTPINFRAFLIVALSVTAAVFCVYAYAFSRAVGIVLGCILLCAICAELAVSILKFRREKVRLRVVLAFALALIASTSAFSVGCANINAWARSQEQGGSQAVIGRVCYVDVRSGEYRVDLDELTLGGTKADGVLRLSFDPDISAIAESITMGDRIAFGANVKINELYEDGEINGSAYRSDIRYYATITDDNVSIMRGNPKPLERFLQALHGLYLDNMGEKYGNIAFSMITGDKHSLDGDITDYFSAAGLGHIMAVSGLHIGFLTIVLNLVLCKVGKKIRLPIIGAVLLAYTVMADFSPSVVRAVVMAFASSVALIVGGRHDILSSLLCAFSLILAVKPLYLFEAGFLLSFGAILGIAMFANMIGRALRRHGANNKVSSAISASVSVSVGILPAEVYFFNQFQLTAVLANMILLPYVSVVFISIFVLTPIAAIPGCGAVLIACKYLLIPLDYISFGLAQIPYGVLYIKSRAAVFACYPVMFGASDFFMLKKGKAASIIYAAVVCIAIIAVCAV
ncbi:MAG: ComEC/Rec2 family competence protein [Clostridiales bacterium]|nr:ComEC/Rec2 family competence protein [Clostridiales bacterium]